MKQSAKVPCGSCRACCKGHEHVVLHPTDDHSKYLTKIDAYGNIALQHQLNGDCVYFVDDACSIYGEAPLVCRSFDCRHTYLMYKSMSPEDRIVLLNRDDAYRLFNRGRQLQNEQPLTMEEAKRRDELILAEIG